MANMAKILCSTCNKVYIGNVPKYEGGFPKKRICKQCGAVGYLMDLDNGNFNPTLSETEISQVRMFGKPILI
jgi:hypothetical protein